MELSKNLLNQLTPYELESLKEIIDELLGVKIAKTSTNHEIIEKGFHMETCLHCGSKHFIKHGHHKGDNVICVRMKKARKHLVQLDLFLDYGEYHYGIFS